MDEVSTPCILIIGEAVAPTGFARVIRSIFTPLNESYELREEGYTLAVSIVQLPLGRVLHSRKKLPRRVTL